MQLELLVIPKILITGISTKPDVQDLGVIFKLLYKGRRSRELKLFLIKQGKGDVEKLGNVGKG